MWNASGCACVTYVCYEWVCWSVCSLYSMMWYITSLICTLYLQMGMTAVMRASKYDHTDVVDYLVRSCKASVTTRDNVSVNYP